MCTAATEVHIEQILLSPPHRGSAVRCSFHQLASLRETNFPVWHPKKVLLLLHAHLFKWQKEKCLISNRGAAQRGGHDTSSHFLIREVSNRVLALPQTFFRWLFKLPNGQIGS